MTKKKTHRQLLLEADTEHLFEVLASFIEFWGAVEGLSVFLAALGDAAFDTNDVRAAAAAIAKDLRKVLREHTTNQHKKKKTKVISLFGRAPK